MNAEEIIKAYDLGDNTRVCEFLRSASQRELDFVTAHVRFINQKRICQSVRAAINGLKSHPLPKACDDRDVLNRWAIMLGIARGPNDTDDVFRASLIDRFVQRFE